MGVKENLRRAASITSFVVLSLVACSTLPSPFPERSLGSDDEVLSLLRERTGAVRSLYAVLLMSHDTPEVHGTFDVVCNYEAPRRLRLQAFKDLLLLGERDVFDLLFTESRYAIDLAGRNGTAPVADRGPFGDFAKKHPDLAGLALTGEGLFLPGVMAAGAPARVERTGDDVRIDSTLPSGASVTWLAAARTLEVRSGRVRGSGREVVLGYGAYRATSGTFLPWSVTYDDPAARTRVAVHVKEVEVNVPIDPVVLDAERR